LSVYRDALPALFTALDRMPEGLRRHVRYPQDLFEAQVAKYSRYHMTVPQVFYNDEDLWAVPRERSGGEQIVMEPYYVLMKLPQEGVIGCHARGWPGQDELQDGRTERAKQFGSALPVGADRRGLHRAVRNNLADSGQRGGGFQGS
jgi:hypothetical protein